MKPIDILKKLYNDSDSYVFILNLECEILWQNSDEEIALNILKEILNEKKSSCQDMDNGLPSSNGMIMFDNISYSYQVISNVEFSLTVVAINKKSILFDMFYSENTRNIINNESLGIRSSIYSIFDEVDCIYSMEEEKEKTEIKNNPIFRSLDQISQISCSILKDVIYNLETTSYFSEFSISSTVVNVKNFMESFLDEMKNVIGKTISLNLDISPSLYIYVNESRFSVFMICAFLAVQRYDKARNDVKIIAKRNGNIADISIVAKKNDENKKNLRDIKNNDFSEHEKVFFIIEKFCETYNASYYFESHEFENDVIHINIPINNKIKFDRVFKSPKVVREEVFNKYRVLLNGIQQNCFYYVPDLH